MIRTLRGATREDLKRYLLKIQREKKNAQTIHHTFVGIGSLMQYLEEEGLIEINPVPSFRRRYLRNVMRELTVFFDDETARVLRRSLIVREARGADPKRGPLFTGVRGGRIHKDTLRDPFIAYARVVGLHKPGGALKERFTPHCCRHWFTTWLRRRKMDPAHVAWLRGDKESSTQSIYNHIEPRPSAGRS